PRTSGDRRRGWGPGAHKKKLETVARPFHRRGEGATEMAEVTQQQVVEYIKGISVLELSQLVKTLEAELGVSAAAAMPMAMPMGAAAGAAAPVEEKTEFT